MTYLSDAQTLLDAENTARTNLKAAVLADASYAAYVEVAVARFRRRDRARVDESAQTGSPLLGAGGPVAPLADEVAAIVADEVARRAALPA